MFFCRRRYIFGTKNLSYKAIVILSCVIIRGALYEDIKVIYLLHSRRLSLLSHDAGRRSLSITIAVIVARDHDDVIVLVLLVGEVCGGKSIKIGLPGKLIL